VTSFSKRIAALERSVAASAPPVNEWYPYASAKEALIVRVTQLAEKQERIKAILEQEGKVVQPCKTCDGTGADSRCRCLREWRMYLQAAEHGLADL
jgi:hypothetical protein